MYKLATFFAAASFLAGTLAFEGTAPFLMWSPKEFPNVASLAAQSALTSQQFQATQKSFIDAACASKTVLLADQVGLHASDLASSNSGPLSNDVKNAKTKVEIPYVMGGVDMAKLKDMIVKQCNPEIVTIGEHRLVAFPPSDNAQLVFFPLPALAKENRKESLANNEQAVSDWIGMIRERVQDDYVVMLSSSHPENTPTARQLLFQQQTPGNSTGDGLFQKYTFFSPDMILIIFILLLLLVILGVAITALASIQTPLRFEGKPKKA
ncbi:uncharacterized protein VTP21DRAFT_7942 [Calcarisporiella thermophila]|uniref:uncharacterized protein n=1 Tax=Calcarisporiella thermophila TaxID=911321 RepID=UPI00374229C7